MSRTVAPSEPLHNPHAPAVPSSPYFPGEDEVRMALVSSLQEMGDVGVGKKGKKEMEGREGGQKKKIENWGREESSDVLEPGRAPSHHAVHRRGARVKGGREKDVVVMGGGGIPSNIRPISSDPRTSAVVMAGGESDESLPRAIAALRGLGEGGSGGEEGEEDLQVLTGMLKGKRGSGGREELDESIPEVLEIEIEVEKALGGGEEVVKEVEEEEGLKEAVSNTTHSALGTRITPETPVRPVVVEEIVEEGVERSEGKVTPTRQRRGKEKGVSVGQWRSALSPDGRLYYYNKADRTPLWKLPPSVNPATVLHRGKYPTPKVDKKHVEVEVMSAKPKKSTPASHSATRGKRRKLASDQSTDQVPTATTSSTAPTHVPTKERSDDEVVGEEGVEVDAEEDEEVEEREEAGVEGMDVEEEADEVEEEKRGGEEESVDEVVGDEEKEGPPLATPTRGRTIEKGVDVREEEVERDAVVEEEVVEEAGTVVKEEKEKAAKADTTHHTPHPKPASSASSTTWSGMRPGERGRWSVGGLRGKLAKRQTALKRSLKRVGPVVSAEPKGGEEQCPQCGRRFAQGRLAPHAKVCEFVFGKKQRAVFSSKRSRLSDTPAEKFAKIPPCAHCGREFSHIYDRKLHLLLCGKEKGGVGDGGRGKKEEGTQGRRKSVGKMTPGGRVRPKRPATAHVRRSMPTRFQRPATASKSRTSLPHSTTTSTLQSPKSSLPSSTWKSAKPSKIPIRDTDSHTHHHHHHLHSDTLAPGIAPHRPAASTYSHIVTHDKEEGDGGGEGIAVDGGHSMSMEMVEPKRLLFSGTNGGEGEEEGVGSWFGDESAILPEDGRDEKEALKVGVREREVEVEEVVEKGVERKEWRREVEEMEVRDSLGPHASRLASKLSEKAQRVILGSKVGDGRLGRKARGVVARALEGTVQRVGDVVLVHNPNGYDVGGGRALPFRHPSDTQDLPLPTHSRIPVLLRSSLNSESFSVHMA